MRVFFATLGFLTRLPAPSSDILPQKEFKKGIVYYPLIGLITGAIMAVLFFVLDSADTRLPSAVLTVAAQAAITGGFHLDGLSDSFDGLFSAREKERMLEIMRDSRIGAFGVLGMLFTVLTKIAVLYSLPARVAVLTIALYPVAGKTITPILMRSRYARAENGLGSIYLNEKYTFPMLLAMLFGTVMIALGLKQTGCIALLFAAVFAIFFRRYCQKTLGGMTGDTLGGGVELSEAVFLLAVLYTRRLL